MPSAHCQQPALFVLSYQILKHCRIVDKGSQLSEIYNASCLVDLLIRVLSLFWVFSLCIVLHGFDISILLSNSKMTFKLLLLIKNVFASTYVFSGNKVFDADDDLHVYSKKLVEKCTECALWNSFSKGPVNFCIFLLTVPLLSKCICSSHCSKNPRAIDGVPIQPLPILTNH